jgi:hypothetical protein
MSKTVIVIIAGVVTMYWGMNYAQESVAGYLFLGGLLMIIFSPFLARFVNDSPSESTKKGDTSAVGASVHYSTTESCPKGGVHDWQRREHPHDRLPDGSPNWSMVCSKCFKRTKKYWG